MPERWRAIPENRLLGVQAGYEASNETNVRSVPRTLRNGRAAGGVVLAKQRDKDGYATVKLGRKRVRVAVVVQLAFAGPPEVRHLDGDRENDRPENLAWGSRVENERDKTRGRERNEEKRNGKNEGEGDERERDEIGRGRWERPFPVGTPGTGDQALCSGSLS